jgi:DNA-binding MltR family transcriptional regulator
MSKTKNLPNNLLLNKEILEELQTGTDRAKVILGATIIETQLERLLSKGLVQNNAMQKECFEFNGFLGTFSSKINAAFLLGLISKEIFNDIHRLRKLRNSFAHDLINCSFSNDSIIEEVHKFKLVKDCFKTNWDKQSIAVVYLLQIATLFVALTKKTVRATPVPAMQYELADLGFEEQDFKYLEEQLE